MARATVTLSLQSDYNGAAPRTSSRVRSVLRRAGFLDAGTATWECEDQPMPVLLTALDRVTKILRAEGAAQLDHFWISVR
jgi:hypothetical protein